MFKNYIEYVKGFDKSKIPCYKPKIFEKPQIVEFGRLKTVAGDSDWIKKLGEQKMIGDWGVAENRSACYCRLLFIDNVFYVFILSGKTYYVRGFDRNWNLTGFEKRLTPIGIEDFDQDVTFNGECIYESAQGGGWCQVRKFDKKFNLVKQTPIIKSSKDEFNLDLNIATIKGRICLGTEYRENGDWRENPLGLKNVPPSVDLKRGLHLRIFDSDLNLIQEKDLIANIKNAVVPHQYWGMGASQLYADNFHCVVTHSPIGNTTVFDQNESIGARQIFILRFDDDFNFIDSKGPLSDTENDNFWCTGSWFEDGRYYISYISRSGKRNERLNTDGLNIPANSGEGLFLSIFDGNFKELETINIANSGSGRSKILKVDNSLYITYDTGKKSFVQELILK